MSIKKQAISAVRWTTTSKIAQAVSTILKISILARFLAKDDFGLMALVTFVLGFLNLFMDMGLSSAILHKQEITKQQYSSLYWINMIFSVILYGILWLLTPYIASFYNESELVNLLPLMGLSLIVSAIGKQFKTIEQKNLNFKFIALVEISSSAISLITAVTLSVLGYGVYSLVYGALAKFILANGVFFIVGVQKKGVLFHFNYPEIKSFVSIGLYQVGGQVVNYFNRDLDILMVGKFFGAEILGGYSLAKQLVFRPAMIINPVLTRVAAPMLAKFQNEIEELRKNYLQLIKVVASINFPIYLGLIIFTPWVVEIFYGPGFEDIEILVRILSVYMMFRAIGNPMGSLVIATGRTDLDFRWSLFNLAIMPLAIYIGAQVSIVGVAISVTVAIMILFVPNWWFLSRRIIKVDFLTYCKAVLPNFHLLKEVLVDFLGKRRIKEV